MSNGISRHILNLFLNACLNILSNLLYLCVFGYTDININFNGAVFGFYLYRLENGIAADYPLNIGGFSGKTFNTLNLYSGNLTNNQAVVNADGKAYGGALFLYAASGEKAAAVFNMYGGKITGNASEKEGGAIFARAGATINILGGEISGNTAATQYNA